MAHDHQEPGWFIPQADGPEHAGRLKAGVMQHMRDNFGPHVRETERAALRWMHDGVSYEARLGERLSFAGVDEGHVWTILATGDLWLVVTSRRGAVKDGPILVGAPSVV